MSISAKEAREIAERTNKTMINKELSDVDRDFYFTLRQINHAALNGEFMYRYTPHVHDYSNVVARLKLLGFKAEYTVFPTVDISW